MINSDKYELILARGFLRRIKEAVEQGIYPDKEKGKEKGTEKEKEKENHNVRVLQSMCIKVQHV